MACGEPSPLLKQIQLAMCQLCGQNMNSSSPTETINYQKQVDPYPMRYTQIFPDTRYDEEEAKKNKKKGKAEIPSMKVCIPIPVVSGKTEKLSETGSTKQLNQSSEKADEPGSNNQTQKGGIASCLPAGGCPPPVKMMLCLPCPPPDSVAGTSGLSGSGCIKPKPKDYTYRCESRELRAGNLYHCCQCNKRNGLQHDCPRSPCQGRPACLVRPWPDCWPSGGCHGIDYSREKGTKRIDPCLAQRFDKKECKPPGEPRAECGGNMMLVVCPPGGGMSNC